MAAIRDIQWSSQLGAQVQTADPRTAGQPRAPNKQAVDAQIGVKELEALRLHVDGVAPPEAAEGLEHLVATFRADVTTGDHLRLPPPRNSDARAVRGALDRILSAERQPTAAPREAIEKEARMLAVLRGFTGVSRHIHGRANYGAGY